MQNRFPGTCTCGTWVEAQTGQVFKAGAGWQVQCLSCAERPGQSTQSLPEAREMLGTIYWPNGLGETICTIEYEEAVNASRDARAAVEDAEEFFDLKVPESAAHFRRLEQAAYEAENKVAQLQAEGGHMGERITYDAPNVMTALLAGGKVTIAPGGGMQVKQI